jgi:hypothetical protein
LVHRDFKPETVMLDEAGSAISMDFEIANSELKLGGIDDALEPAGACSASSGGWAARRADGAFERPPSDVIDLLVHSARERHNLDGDPDEILLAHLPVC